MYWDTHVRVGVEQEIIYIYIYRERERLKNKVIQREKINAKESQCFNVSVQMNHHQDVEKMKSGDGISAIRKDIGDLTSPNINLSKS